MWRRGAATVERDVSIGRCRSRPQAQGVSEGRLGGAPAHYSIDFGQQSTLHREIIKYNTRTLLAAMDHASEVSARRPPALLRLAWLRCQAIALG